jgi:hypothetical protein
MTLLDYWHEEYYDETDHLVLFRCRECGLTSMSLGSLHAHVEGHRGYTRFNIQIPFTKTWIGDFEALMDRTEVLRVEEMAEIDLDEWPSDRIRPR